MIDQNKFDKILCRAVNNGYKQDWHLTTTQDYKFNLRNFYPIVFSNKFAEAYWKGEWTYNEDKLRYPAYFDYIKTLASLPDGARLEYLYSFLEEK